MVGVSCPQNRKIPILGIKNGVKIEDALNEAPTLPYLCHQNGG